MPASSRNERLRARREECATLSELAVEFGLSKTRIVQILERTGGDPMAAGRRLDLRDVPVAQLEAEASRLAARVAAARRRLQILRDEMSARQTDRILGLGASPDTNSGTNRGAQPRMRGPNGWAVRA